MAVKLETGLIANFAEAVDCGIDKVIIDLHRVKELHMGIVKLLAHTTDSSNELSLHLALVASKEMAVAFKVYQDTCSWAVFALFDAAKASLSMPEQTCLEKAVRA